MCTGEPKAAEKTPFKAGSGLNALANFKVFITQIKNDVNPIYKKNKFIFLR